MSNNLKDKLIDISITKKEMDLLLNLLHHSKYSDDKHQLMIKIDKAATLAWGRGIRSGYGEKIVPGSLVEASVFAIGPYGIHLKTVDYTSNCPIGTEILVHSSDVEWTDKISTFQYTSVGEVLVVKILEEVDGNWRGWLPPPQNTEEE